MKALHILAQLSQLGYTAPTEVAQIIGLRSASDRYIGSWALRVYDPIFKFKEKPAHVQEDVWIALRDECERHLRVELMFAKRELQSAGLSTVAARADHALVEQLVEKRYKDYGLSVAFSTKALRREEVIATNPAFVEAARFFFTEGTRGHANRYP